MSEAPAYTRFDDLLGQVQKNDDAFKVSVTPDWMQGRTLYGGISAALCHQAARLEFPDLPPLRSALFSFVGPASGDVSMTTRLLRQGKSATYINVDLMSEAGFGTHASFCFGATRESSQRQTRLPAPDLPEPTMVATHFPKDGPMPSFARHFDMRLARGSRPVSGAKEADMQLWMKALDSGQASIEATLLALADAPPPAALSLFSTFTPISTMTWMVDFLSTDLSSSDGWYCAHIKSDVVGDGYSAQSTSVWSVDGRPLIASRQSVALFG